MLIGNPGKVALRRLALVENRLLFRGKRRGLGKLGRVNRLALAINEAVLPRLLGADSAPRVNLRAAVQLHLRDGSVAVHPALRGGCCVWIGGFGSFLAHKIPHA